MTQDNVPIAPQDDIASKSHRQRVFAVILLSSFPGSVILFSLLLIGWANFYGLGEVSDFGIWIETVGGILFSILVCISVPMAVIGTVLCFTRWAASRNWLINVLVLLDIVVLILVCFLLVHAA